MDERFVPGLELSRRFYREAVRPVLDDAVPGLPHAAALLGPGSEVLGFDTARSTDHDWGPRVQIFLRPRDVSRHAARFGELLSRRLPRTFLGHPAGFAAADGDHVRHMSVGEGPIEHGVLITDAGSWLIGHLGFDPRGPVTVADWLATPAQRLAEVTRGAVFHDGVGELTIARAVLAWYPHELWLHLLACQWWRVAEEEAFTGRCGEAGDELGSAVVAARIVRDLMRLCLLMDRRYPPYAKWLGSAFARTPYAPALTPSLSGALAATTWRDRERHLTCAYETIAAAHNRLGLTDPLDPATSAYHRRPFQVLHAARFAEALTARIGDPDVRKLPRTGGVDQFVDGIAALGSQGLTRAAVAASAGLRAG